MSGGTTLEYGHGQLRETTGSGWGFTRAPNRTCQRDVIYGLRLWILRFHLWSHIRRGHWRGVVTVEATISTPELSISKPMSLELV